MHVIDTPEGIAAYRLLVLRSRLKLEILGMRSQINTAEVIRREFNLPIKNRKKLLAAYEQILKDAGILK
jgi:hypothetical protein